MKMETYLLLIQWEENQLGSVFLKPLSILLQRLYGFVPSSWINSNADSSGKVFVQTTCFQFCEGETLSGTNFRVIPDRGAVNHWPQKFCWPIKISFIKKL